MPRRGALLNAPGDEPGYDEAGSLLFSLVYCSHATPGVDGAAMDRIIESSRRRNAAQGITGVLVFGSGIFFQWLEGPRAAVERLMALLGTDSRHVGIVRLSEVEEVRERLFPGWDMEPVAAEDVRAVLLDALDATEDARSAQALRGMLARIEAEAA